MIFLVFEILLYLILAALLGFFAGWLLRGGAVRKLRRSEAALRKELEALRKGEAEAAAEPTGRSEAAEAAPEDTTPKDAAPETTASEQAVAGAAEPAPSDTAAPVEPALPAGDRRKPAARRRSRPRRRGTLATRPRLKRPRLKRRRSRRGARPRVGASL